VPVWVHWPTQRDERMAKRRIIVIARQLKNAIRRSGRTHYRIAKDAKISPDIIDRFMSGERDIRLATAEKIAAALNLELQPIDDEGT